MKINIFPIVSNLHELNLINEETKNLLNYIKNELNADINICKIDELYNSDLALILIQSGGSEQIFLNNLTKLKEPYYLLTYGSNNSLAASLEILSYIKDRNLKGEVIHGSNSYVTRRIKELSFKLKPKTLGVIGRPSDWLIASDINYEDALSLYNITLKDISINEVINEYNKIEFKDILPDVKNDKLNLNDAKKLTLVLQKIKDKYNLSGLTIRCFDLLNPIHTTACLGLAYFNSLGIVSACEGDIPSLISMYLVNELFNKPSFMANPSRIDIINKKMIFAHCTLPLNMTKSYKLDTHYESNIGVAIKGEMKEDVITIFKLSRNLKDYFVTSGKIIKNLNETNLCRTQIEVEVDNNIEYFLNRPYGNHHIIFYGNYVKEINDFLKNRI